VRILILSSEPGSGGVEQIVARLGHAVELAASGGPEESDLVVVRLDVSSGGALEWLDRVLAEASCPVVAIVSGGDPARAMEAARRGVFACLPVTSDAELADALEITLARFVAYDDLHGAFGGRAVVGQATGILMGHHGIDAERATAMLVDHSASTGENPVDVAAALVSSHALLVSAPADGSE
jgi:AmiR/NasT family two-component response regulator